MPDTELCGGSAHAVCLTADRSYVSSVFPMEFGSLPGIKSSVLTGVCKVLIIKFPHHHKPTPESVAFFGLRYIQRRFIIWTATMANS